MPRVSRSIYWYHIPSRGETATGSRAISPSARLQGGVLPLDLKLQIPHYLWFLLRHVCEITMEKQKNNIKHHNARRNTFI